MVENLKNMTCNIAYKRLDPMSLILLKGGLVHYFNQDNIIVTWHKDMKDHKLFDHALDVKYQRSSGVHDIKMLYDEIKIRDEFYREIPKAIEISFHNGIEGIFKGVDRIYYNLIYQSKHSKL